MKATKTQIAEYLSWYSEPKSIKHEREMILTGKIKKLSWREMTWRDSVLEDRKRLAAGKTKNSG